MAEKPPKRPAHEVLFNHIVRGKKQLEKKPPAEEGREKKLERDFDNRMLRIIVWESCLLLSEIEIPEPVRPELRQRLVALDVTDPVWDKKIRDALRDLIDELADPPPTP